MLTDRYGTRHASASEAAVAAFEDAILAVAAHRPGALEAVRRALAADPQLAAAHALEGFALVLLARQELVPRAAAAHARAKEALAKRAGTSSEVALIEALGAAAAGRLSAAASVLEAHLRRHPTELLPAKVAQALRFMTGDARAMLSLTRDVIGAWSETMPGYGFLLGCHAFALEEVGELAVAERTGRRAVELEPSDAWGLHAVSHVHEMTGRTREGVAWLERHRTAWSRCNNFSFHLAWHLALLHLENGDHERVLWLYDREVRPAPTDDFRDVANAVSLLWRLEQEGVEVGGRWAELRDIAFARRRDTTLAFAALHNLLALIATGELDGARELLASMRLKAASAGCDQSKVMAAVGGELGALILRVAAGGGGPVPIGRLADRLHLLGGSHAQRDVFLRTLAAAAADHGDRQALQGVLAVRRRIKRDDGFVTLLQQRVAQARSARATRAPALANEG